MRRPIFLVALVLLGAMPMSGQQLENSRPERYPAGSIGEASRQHALTLSEVHRLLDVYDTLQGEKGSEAASQGPSLSDSMSLAEGIAEVGRSPAAMRAVSAARFSPAEFVVASAALVEALETVVLQRIAGPYAPPTRGRWENVALYLANQAEFDKRLGLGENEGGVAKDRAVLPAATADPRTARAAAATHVLTWDELRRLVTLSNELVAVARTDTAVFMLLRDDDRTAPLDARAERLSRSSKIRAVAAKRGFTVRQFLVANAAYEEVLEAAMGPDDSPVKSPATARARNVALFRRHEREITTLILTPATPSASNEQPTIEADTLYRRRLRQVDSLSRFVRTDSLARLMLGGLSVSQDALPRLGQDVTCETTRLHWRHGIAPATIAIRRMRDSLWAGRQEDYRRSNDRLYPYAMSAPMTDVVCGQSRWPRAPDSLDVMPRARVAP